MGWRDERPEQAADSSTADEHVVRSGPFRVAIKSSACYAVASLDRLRRESGEIVVFDSFQAARRELIAGLEVPGLRFQGPAPNDPAEVDAYLVSVGEPDPEPTERGPPDEGWTFRMTAQQVGELSEALFDAYRWNPPPIVAYASQDLELGPDDFRIDTNRSPSSVGAYKSHGGSGVWVPDLEFIVRRVTEASPTGYSGPVIKRYIAEVKHGSTSFERNQLARMTELAEQTGSDVDVLIIRVDLDGAPREYDLRIRKTDQVDPGSA